MSREARVVAQAKVNLFLRILAREDSGYHQIETLFCRLALGDGVTVRAEGRGRSLDCGGAQMPAGGLGPVERNLAWRAAEAYAAASGWPSGFAIEVDKRIPVGGGLGGGSADAGAVLRCLEALAPRPIGRERLLAIAATLGADVPFLTSESALALAWGRGERMLALPAPPVAPVLLLTSREGVSTKDAYGWLAESRRNRPAAPPAPTLLDPTELSTWEGIARLAHNDFEPVVRARHAGVDAVLRRLRGGEARDLLGERGFALMSGSGATVFAVPLLDGDAGDAHRAYGLEGAATPPLALVTTSAPSVVPVEPSR